ncbi:MAG: cytochrome c biogenesis protein CcsA [Anaerolineae bacterium]
MSYASVKLHQSAAERPVEHSHRRDLLLQVLSVLAVLGVLVGLYFALIYTQPDALQGNIQRIFYIHVPSFMAAFLGFSATVFGGIAYLRTRNPKWDTLAVAGVEVGLVMSIITLATGSIWARPIWNTWWTWDPRLTSAAIMALTYAAYLMLRSGIENPNHKRTFSSVYGILAFSTVIFTFIVIRIRPDTIHPAVIGSGAEGAEGGFAMAGEMVTALMVNMVVWSALVAPTLMWWRIRLENTLQENALLKIQIEDE